MVALEAEIRFNDYAKRGKEIEAMVNRLKEVQIIKSQLGSINVGGEGDNETMSISEVSSKRSSKSNRSKRGENNKNIRKAKPGSRNEEYCLVNNLNEFRKNVENTGINII